MPTISRFIQQRGPNAQLGGVEITHVGAVRWQQFRHRNKFLKIVGV